MTVYSVRQFPLGSCFLVVIVYSVRHSFRLESFLFSFFGSDSLQRFLFFLVVTVYSVRHTSPLGSWSALVPLRRQYGVKLVKRTNINFVYAFLTCHRRVFCSPIVIQPVLIQHKLTRFFAVLAPVVVQPQNTRDLFEEGVSTKSPM